MSDPTFATREALQRWEQGAVATVCAMAKLDDLRVGDMLKVADSIERVRAAHDHLLGNHMEKGNG